MDSAVDNSHHHYAIDLTLSAEALLFGRNTFDLFMQFWPGATNVKDLPEATQTLAKAFNQVSKLVVSSLPVDLSWRNTRHIPGVNLNNVVQELEKIQGTVVIFGSPCLTSNLLNEGLINEIHILAQPYIGVEGPRAFSGLKRRINLNLLVSRTLDSGSVLMRYSVI